MSSSRIRPPGGGLAPTPPVEPCTKRRTPARPRPPEPQRADDIGPGELSQGAVDAEWVVETRGEVDDGVDAGRRSSGVRRSRSSDSELGAGDRGAAALDRHDVVAVGDETRDDMAADEARPAGDEDAHGLQGSAGRRRGLQLGNARPRGDRRPAAGSSSVSPVAASNRYTRSVST